MGGPMAAAGVKPEQRNRVITLGTDRVVLRVVKPPTTAEMLDAMCVKQGRKFELDDWDPLMPRTVSKPVRTERRGRS